MHATHRFDSTTGEKYYEYCKNNAIRSQNHDQDSPIISRALNESSAKSTARIVNKINRANICGKINRLIRQNYPRINGFPF